MTMKIEVTIPEDDIKAGAAAHYLTRAMAAIGFSRGVSLPMPDTDMEAVRKAVEAGPGPVVLNEALAEEGPNYAAMKAAADEQEAASDIRYHGQPSGGGKRRTKAEITLDEEAKDLCEDVGVSIEQFNAALDKTGGDWDAVMADLRAAAAAKAGDASEEKPAISTGEERVDPANPPEDEADEGEPLTRDDVREALGDYAAKFGMPAAQKNGPKLMGADKISAIPEDQAALRKAVTAIRYAIEKGEA